MDNPRVQRHLPKILVGVLISVVLLSRCAASILTPLWLDALDKNGTSNNCSAVTYANIHHVDAYTTMFIVSFLYVVLFAVLMVFNFCTCRISERETSYPKSDFVLIGISDTLAGICFVYASSGCRTAPYLQALGTNFSVPVTFIVRFCLLRIRPTLRKTVCAILVIIAEFTALIPSIFPGLQSQQAITVVGGATGPGSVLWPICFFFGYIPLAIVSTVIERAVQERGDRSGDVTDSTTELNVVYVLFWCYLFSFITLIGLFWTDFIPGFGMTSGPREFIEVFWFNIKCYFGAVECKGVINIYLVALPCTVFLVVMRVANTYFLRYLEGANYLVMISSMQTPLVFIFFTLFDENPFKWHPHGYLSTWLSVAALCIMLPAVYIYDTGPPEKRSNGLTHQINQADDDLTQPLLHATEPQETATEPVNT